MTRQRVYSGAPWESKIGYCRAVRAGALVFVTGSVPQGDDGRPYGVGDGYAQARRSLEIIEAAVAECGGRREHIVRTRMFVTDITRWEEYGRAHAEFFGEHHPASTMVEVRRLIGDDFLIEIEADAVLDEAPAPPERRARGRGDSEP